MKVFEYKNHLREIEHIGSRLVLGDEKRLSSPLVTVIMPIYNHPDYFRKSLGSVLNQKCDFEYEVIIVDNGHPTLQEKNQNIVEELMTPYTWYFVNNENVGGCNNQNIGILLAKGKHITFCHDDDILTENALQILIDNAQRYPNTEIAVFGNLKIIDGEDKFTYRYDEWESLFLKTKKSYRVTMYDFLQRNYTNGCGSLYSREQLLEIGGFNSDYIPCPDYALNVKYTSLYGGIAIRDVTLHYRVTPQSDSSSAFVHIVEANKKIQDNIIESGLVSKSFPYLLVKSNQICSKYHLYSKWADKPKGVTYFFYRVLYRIWINSLQIIRSCR